MEAKKKEGLNPKLQLSVPRSDDVSFAKFLTQSGTFKEGDLLVIIKMAPPIQPTDNQYSPWSRIFRIFGINELDIVLGCSHGHVLISQAIQVNFQETLVKQIAQELKINQSAQCTNVAICYQSFYENGVISIILEYMDGGSLSDFLKKVVAIPEPYLAAICKQVLKGLWYLHHDKHIIHRDMKPSNLLINHRGEVKITDFGVSAILATTSAERNTFVGTYNYMSPERITGEAYRYKSDIWSLGLVILECATGRFPYAPSEPEEGWDNCYELMEAIVDRELPHAPPEKFSPEFCSFISACLQKDPKVRLAADELMEHPFIKKYEDKDVNLASYFSDAGSPLATFGTPI
ncbi:hypothetical protein MKW94_000401, partial [Papaver nudicaule]|nr:hypothetical protein [Papaver nudicaule]